MSDSRVTVHTEARIDGIEPEVHGHFAEHLGRCIYDGVWEDENPEPELFVPARRSYKYDTAHV